MTPTLQDKMLAHENAGCPLARELRVLRAMCSCRNDDCSVDEAEARYLELRALATVAAQGEEQTVPLSQFRDAVEARLYNVPAALALAKMLAPGHRLIYRDSFRWKDDHGNVLPNHYDGMDASKLAADFGYEVTADLGFAAVIRSTIGPPQPASDYLEAPATPPPPQAVGAVECHCPQHGNWISAESVHRLTRQLDVAINGEAGAAKQASLCDIVAQVEQAYREAAAQPQSEGDGWRELARRLYVELFHCDQQMTSGAKKWTQGPTVRDVLAEAKAALATQQAGRVEAKPFGFVYESEFGSFRQHGAMTVYEQRQEFKLLPHEEGIPVYLATKPAATDRMGDFVLVPRQPTEAMQLAGARSLIDGQEGRPGSSFADESAMAYTAMLAASGAAGVR